MAAVRPAEGQEQGGGGPGICVEVVSGLLCCWVTEGQEVKQEGPAGLEGREGSCSAGKRAVRLQDYRGYGHVGQKVQVTGVEVKRAGQPLTPPISTGTQEAGCEHGLGPEISVPRASQAGSSVSGILLPTKYRSPLT